MNTRHKTFTVILLLLLLGANTNAQNPVLRIQNITTDPINLGQGEQFSAIQFTVQNIGNQENCPNGEIKLEIFDYENQAVTEVTPVTQSITLAAGQSQAFSFTALNTPDTTQLPENIYRLRITASCSGNRVDTQTYFFSVGAASAEAIPEIPVEAVLAIGLIISVFLLNNKQ